MIVLGTECSVARPECSQGGVGSRLVEMPERR
jgi:hypothetical protein